jgi:hypothetical protein
MYWVLQVVVEVDRMSVVVVVALTVMPS